MEQIQVSDSLRKFAEKNAPEKLFNVGKNREGKVSYIRNVSEYGMKRMTHGLNRELLKIALQIQFLSFSFMNGRESDFSDVRRCDGRHLAIQYISNYIKQEGCRVTPDWMVMIDIIRNFGVPSNCTIANNFSLPYMTDTYAADHVMYSAMKVTEEEESNIAIANA